MQPPDETPHRLQRAEAVLQRRTSRLVLILERPWNDENVQAVLRTAESFGIQHVWTIKHPHMRGRAQRKVTKGSHQWLTRRFFGEISECVAAAREEGLELWATDLDDGALELTEPGVLRPFPQRVGLIMGREMAGISEELRAATARQIYLPMHGFTESFNLSVAAALVIQRCFDAEPGLVGAMGEDERSELRQKWFARLAGKNDARREAFVKMAEAGVTPLETTRPASESRTPRIKKSMDGYFD